MKTIRTQLIAAALACVTALLTSSSFTADRVSGQEPSQPSADDSAIRKTVEAYVQAFGKHDAKALADLWSPEAVYTNRLTGEQVVGRATIAEQFTALFKEQPELKLDVNPELIQLLSPNAAVEHGMASPIEFT